jgi:hypothetical protein
MPTPTQTLIPTQAVQGPYPTQPVAPPALGVTFTPSDTVNGNYFVADPVTPAPQGYSSALTTGGDILLVQNTNAGTAAFTLTSQPDSAGRSADGSLAPYQLPANSISAFKFSDFNGWADGSGFVYIQCLATGVSFAILQR